MSLTDALKELKSDLASGALSDAEVDALVNEVSDDYDLNPVLVKRKFEESFSKNVYEYKVVDTSAMWAKSAKKRAFEILKENFGSDGWSNLSLKTGDFFEHKDDNYVVVCMSQRGFEVLRVRDQAWRVWNARSDAKAVATLDMLGLL